MELPVAVETGWRITIGLHGEGQGDARQTAQEFIEDYTALRTHMSRSDSLRAALVLAHLYRQPLEGSSDDTD